MKKSLFVISLLVLIFGCGTDSGKIKSETTTSVSAPAGDFTLQLLHLGDTHSRVDSSAVSLKIDINDQNKGCLVYVNSGGYLLAADIIKHIRRQPGSILLHAGDLFQGSLYFTRYLGETDVLAANALRIDAMVPGNHEFDKGPGLIQKMLLEKAAFPVISANLDVSTEPAIKSKDKIRPYIIKNYHGEKVGVIGITLQDTPLISSPGTHIVFNDPATTAQQTIDELTGKGINKIILLTHQGLSEDIALAARLTGADIIVGGHSHSFTGNFKDFGMTTVDAYPRTARDKNGNEVLIVHGWEWAKVIGDLSVTFNPAGEIKSYNAAPVISCSADWMRIYDLVNLEGDKKRVEFNRNGNDLTIREYDGKAYTVTINDDPQNANDQYDAYKSAYRTVIDKMASSNKFAFGEPEPVLAAQMQPYTEGIREFRTKFVAYTTEDLKRGMNRGAGPLIADGMRWRTNADIAINNPGGVRIDIPQGDITVANVYELLPFGNTLVTFNLKGSDLLKALEDMVNFQIERYGINDSNAYVYVSGITFDFYPAAGNGSRIRNAKVFNGNGYSNLDSAGMYKTVVNNFMADGGDNNITLKSITDRYDTGFIDAEVFMEYIQDKNIANVPEKRINIKQ